VEAFGDTEDEEEEEARNKSDNQGKDDDDEAETPLAASEGEIINMPTSSTA